MRAQTQRKNLDRRKRESEEMGEQPLRPFLLLLLLLPSRPGGVLFFDREGDSNTTTTTTTMKRTDDDFIKEENETQTQTFRRGGHKTSCKGEKQAHRWWGKKEREKRKKRKRLSFGEEKPTKKKNSLALFTCSLQSHLSPRSLSLPSPPPRATATHAPRRMPFLARTPERHSPASDRTARHAKSSTKSSSLLTFFLFRRRPQRRKTKSNERLDVHGRDGSQAALWCVAVVVDGSSSERGRAERGKSAWKREREREKERKRERDDRPACRRQRTTKRTNGLSTSSFAPSLSLSLSPLSPSSISFSPLRNAFPPSASLSLSR